MPIILSTLVKLVSLVAASQCSGVSVKITEVIKLARRLTVKDFGNFCIFRSYPARFFAHSCETLANRGVAAASFNFGVYIPR